MNYRLPLLFSIVYFILFWVITLLHRNLFTNLPLETIIYYILITGVQQLTFFWFILLLSCIFFNQQKLYLLTTKNYKLTIILAIVLVVISYTTKFLIYPFAVNLTESILLKFQASFDLYENDTRFFLLILQMAALVTFIAGLLISGLIFYVLIALSKRFFDIPTIENSQTFQSQQIVNQSRVNPNIEKALPKLYGMIFSALFCAVTHGIIWNLYGTCFFYISEVTIHFAEYINIILLSGLVITLADFTLLYITTQNSVKRIYQWLPTGSLLSASAFTIVVFILVNTIILIGLSISLAISHSLSSFLCWFIVLRYIALYLISRFFLKRSFG